MGSKGSSLFIKSCSCFQATVITLISNRKLLRGKPNFFWSKPWTSQKDPYGVQPKDPPTTAVVVEDLG